MLEHQKIILDELRYNKKFFRKELIKSFKWLKSYEILMLYDWLKKNYSNSHEDVIQDIFEYIDSQDN